MDRIREVLDEIASIIVALVRLIFLVFAMITSGMHIVLFTRTEICNIEMRGMPWRCDREKMADQLSFVDSLCISNPELLDYADEHPDAPPPADDEGDMDI